MGEQEQQIKQVELQIEEAKKRIDLMKALRRLTENKDYIKVIDDNYLREEPIRLTYLRADGNFLSDESQDTLMKSIDAIAYFRQYLAAVMQLGMAAANAVEEDERTREELFDEAV